MLLSDACSAHMEAKSKKLRKTTLDGYVSGKTKKMICIKYYDSMTPYGPFSAAGDYIIGGGRA